MTIEELKGITELFEKNEKISNNITKIFHNRESGEAIVIIYNPSVLNINIIKELLILSAEGLRNLLFYYRTKDVEELEKVLAIFKIRKEIV